MTDLLISPHLPSAGAVAQNAFPTMEGVYLRFPGDTPSLLSVGRRNLVRTELVNESPVPVQLSYFNARLTYTNREGKDIPINLDAAGSLAEVAPGNSFAYTYEAVLPSGSILPPDDTYSLVVTAVFEADDVDSLAAGDDDDETARVEATRGRYSAAAATPHRGVRLVEHHGFDLEASLPRRPLSPSSCSPLLHFPLTRTPPPLPPHPHPSSPSPSPPPRPPALLQALGVLAMVAAFAGMVVATVGLLFPEAPGYGKWCAAALDRCLPTWLLPRGEGAPVGSSKAGIVAKPSAEAVAARKAAAVAGGSAWLAGTAADKTRTTRTRSASKGRRSKKD